MTITKAGFYEASQKRDEELSRRSNYWTGVFLAAIFIPMFGALFFLPSGIGSAMQRSLSMAGYLIIVLCLYMPWTRRLHDAINQRHGMKCGGCSNTFESTELTHLGFKNACSKCGRAPFQLD